jgi:3-phosphoshikimate 1-carboxyvinyltransferase
MLIEAGSESGDIIVDTYSDHRIAMAAAVATIKNTRHIIINDGECVRKSYPDFWSDYSSVVRP